MKAPKQWVIRITNLTTLAVTTVAVADVKTARDLARRANAASRGRYLHDVIHR